MIFGEATFFMIIAFAIGIVLGFYIGFNRFYGLIPERSDIKTNSTKETANLKEIQTKSQKASKGNIFCPVCGKETSDDGRFCQWCGANVSSITNR